VAFISLFHNNEETFTLAMNLSLQTCRRNLFNALTHTLQTKHTLQMTETTPKGLVKTCRMVKSPKGYPTHAFELTKRIEDDSYEVLSTRIIEPDGSQSHQSKVIGCYANDEAGRSYQRKDGSLTVL
jgi:hypothetical protein